MSFGLVARTRAVLSGDRRAQAALRPGQPEESPIGYQKICRLEDKPVPDDEIVKAFEIRKGEYVHLSDEDFESARAGGGHTMEITDFVPLADIDPIPYARPYYVGPGVGGEHLYALLAKAMEDSGLAAVVTALAAIEAKQRGGDVAEAAEREEDAAPDLMEALRRSVRSASGGSRRRPDRQRRSSSPGRSRKRAAR